MNSLIDPFNRRQFLACNAMGIGGLALACLLKRDQLLAKSKVIPGAQHSFDLTSKKPHFAPRAQAMISLFMHGGPSHMDLTDPKPELTRLDGRDYSGDVQFSFANEASRKLLASPWMQRR